MADGKHLEGIVTHDGWLADLLANLADGEPLLGMADVNCQLWQVEWPHCEMADVATVADGIATQDRMF